MTIPRWLSVLQCLNVSGFVQSADSGQSCKQSRQRQTARGRKQADEGGCKKQSRQIGQVERAKSNQVYAQWVRSFVRTFAPIARLHSSHCHCHRLSTWCFIAHLVRCRISPYFRPFSPTLQANISGLTWMAKMFAIRCLMQCNVNEVNSICRHAFRSPLFHSFYWPERVSHLLGF